MKVYWRSHRKGSGFSGRFIAWWTFGKYKHTSLVFEDDGSLIGWESTFKGGVHSFEVDTIGGEGIDVKDVPVSSVKAAEMLKWCEDRDGCRYDIKGILGHIRRKKMEDPDKYYCTELAAGACQSVGFYIQEMAPWSITPVVGHASTAMPSRPDL